MKHRKGSVARKIQDYFLQGSPYLDIKEDGKHSGGWCWFPIPNNPEFCVALEWQDGYDGDESDKKIYGIFMEDKYVINVSIKMTDEFRINGDYALYAEYYFNENEDDDLMGGCSLTMEDFFDSFYSISKYLAQDFNRFNRMNRRRD